MATVILITGATHTGKTKLAQTLLEKLHYPYLSIDHIKMGLIRCGYTDLTPDTPDAVLTEYLWPMIRETVKTALENRQNLIIEGCYIPFDWQLSFSAEYLCNMRYLCLAFAEDYIDTHYTDILGHQNDIEHRAEGGWCTKELLKRENARYIAGASAAGLPLVTVHTDYDATLAGAVQTLCKDPAIQPTE